MDNDNEIIKLRNIIAEMPKVLMKHNYNFADYENVKPALDKLEDLITGLEMFFDSKSDNIQTVLGGEFSYYDEEFDEPLNKKTIDIPFYMYLDLILIALNHNMENEVKLASEISKLSTRVQALREKAAHLSYDSKFDSGKHLAEKAIIDISDSRGHYSFHNKEIDGKTYVEVKTRMIREDAKDADYHDHNYSEFGENGLLYQEDRDYFRNIEKNKVQEKVNKIKNHIKKYFVNGEIPKSVKQSDFDALLIDKSIVKEPVFNPLFGLVYALTNNEIEDLDLTFSILLREEKIVRRHAGDGQIPVWAQEVVEPKKEEIVTQSEKKTESKKPKMFERFFGNKNTKKDDNKSESEKDADFEKVRTEQHLEDQKKRRYIIFEVITDENGKETIVSLNADDYEVIPKK